MNLKYDVAQASNSFGFKLENARMQAVISNFAKE